MGADRDAFIAQRREYVANRRGANRRVANRRIANRKVVNRRGQTEEGLPLDLLILPHLLTG